MNQKITIKKIAEHCGVSIATVSRAINGSSYVSAELQKKIREYIEDVGWHPSGLIRKLPDKMNTEIIVVGSLSLLEHAENSQGLKLLLENLYQAGFSPVLRLGHRAETLRQCLKEKPSLVLLSGYSDRLYNEVKQLLEAGIRVVGLGDSYEPPCQLLSSDHCAAAREAAAVLKKNGARKIAFFAGMGAQPHPDDLIKIYPPAARMIQGIQKIFPEFDYTRDAVSDCFGDLSTFREMLSNDQYDGWILSGSDRLNEMISQIGAIGVMNRKVVLLQPYPTKELPPVCLQVLVENVSERYRKLVECLQRPFVKGGKNIFVPYFGLNSGKK